MMMIRHKINNYKNDDDMNDKINKNGNMKQ